MCTSKPDKCQMTSGSRWMCLFQTAAIRCLLFPLHVFQLRSDVWLKDGVVSDCEDTSESGVMGKCVRSGIFVLVSLLFGPRGFSVTLGVNWPLEAFFFSAIMNVGIIWLICLFVFGALSSESVHYISKEPFKHAISDNVSLSVLHKY